MQECWNYGKHHNDLSILNIIGEIVSMSRSSRVLTQSKETFFAGFDLSLSATGIVILDGAGKVYERHIIKPKTRGAERLDEIQTKIRSIITPYTLKLVCIEGYAMGSTNGMVFNIGELGGVIRLLLHRMGIPYIDPKPTALKKFATGAGGGEGGSKDQVTMFCYKNWGFEGKDNNECDAFVLARIALALFDRGGPLLKHQREVVDVIRNPPVKKPKKKKEE